MNKKIILYLNKLIIFNSALFTKNLENLNNNNNISITNVSKNSY